MNRPTIILLLIVVSLLLLECFLAIAQTKEQTTLAILVWLFYCSCLYYLLKD
jgi:predicted CDP-diglyceride synthetase/phosphatidate cytidylyltransferase